MNKFDLNKILRFLSSKTKRSIIMHLYLCKCNDCSVNSLCYFSNAKQANISKHLMDLKDEEIVYFEKNKKESKYFLTHEFKSQYLNLLEQIKSLEEKSSCNCKMKGK